MHPVRILSLTLLLASSPLLAQEAGDFSFNGFGTLGITRLGGEDSGRSYGIQGQVNDRWRGDELSRLGGQFTYHVRNDLVATAQVKAAADQDSWGLDLDWLYLAWETTDRLTLRAGRLRNPVYMYSETLNVGVTYPWLRLPDEVYYQLQIADYEGADLLYSIPLDFGSLTWQVNGGQAHNRNHFIHDDQHDMDYRKIFGINATLTTHDWGTFRIAYSEASLNMHLPYMDGTPLEGIADDVKGKFTAVGYQYDDGTWMATSEATRIVIEGLTPSYDAFYVMAGRRFGNLGAHLTYAQLDDEFTGRQSSWTGGLTYRLTPMVILKGEYKRVDNAGGSQGVFVREGNEYLEALARSQLLGQPMRTFDGDILSAGIDFLF
ncbi:MAG TPA: putative porin [Candidatus Pseudomonas excrementavium]|uniref:porin n=1 Tax=Halopseudomonas bauzanensis TaxID=653930 RepID=UPI001C39ED8A|nr:porin [Halopseudomonas bauzanensis]HIZ52059.1 putative porin [Candidatus Pseudomonas excrementavium]